MRSHYLVLLTLFAAARAVWAESPFAFESTPGQLPKTIVPRHYALKIQPDLANFTTRGSLTVDIQVLKPTRTIVLNALDLEITRAVLQGRPEIVLQPLL